MSPEDSGTENSGRGLLKGLFGFLRELNQLRNPVPFTFDRTEDVLFLEDWPKHPFVQVWRGDAETADSTDGKEGDSEVLIRIKRVELTQCPSPPEELDEWLIPGWQDAGSSVAILPSRNFQWVEDREQKTKTVAFEDDLARVSALEAWKSVRAKWALAERPALLARRLFETVHGLWTKLEREGDRKELILADGMLSVPETRIRYPVLFQRLSLEFDRNGPEFQFLASEGDVELNRPLLRLIPGIEGRMIAHCDKELQQELIEPLGGEATHGFLRRLIQGLFTNGQYLDMPLSRTADAKFPVLWREAVIFLRARTAGLSGMIDSILEDLEDESKALPDGLVRLVGVDSKEDDPPTPGETAYQQPHSVSVQISESEILFSKPANTEQFEIARRLSKSKSVLVQGPPGTGKTHTIANLLGHLLAQGKTVLVTAHTTKALRVLREKVDAALQALCLSVLEHDAENKSLLASAVQVIADRLSRSDAATLRREAAHLREKRGRNLEKSETLRRELREARFSEVEEIVFGGSGLSPIEAAKVIKVSAEKDGWLPGPIERGSLCPLTEGEVRELYATQAILPEADEIHLGVAQPALANLVPLADFQILSHEQQGADSRAKAHRPELWTEPKRNGFTAAHLQTLHQRVRVAVAVLAENHEWLREVLYASWKGGELRESWSDLLAEINALSENASKAHRLIVRFGPQLPADHNHNDLSRILGEIIVHLERGGTLGLKTKLLNRDWHRLVEHCRVENRIPATLDEFRALHALTKLAEARLRFSGRWRRAVESLGGPSVEELGRSPERTAQGYAEEIRARLYWREEVWEPLLSELCEAGFQWHAWLAMHPPVPGDHGELARLQRAGAQALAEIVEAQAARLRQIELAFQLEEQRTYLSSFPQSEIASVLLHAQESWDSELYGDAVRELARVEGFRPLFETRQTQLSILRTVAPEWARAITGKLGVHAKAFPPGDPIAAWRWLQLYQELERRASVSMSELQGRLDKLEAEQRLLAAQIIEHETWAAQCERTGLREQQALVGWVKTQNKITKSKRGVRDSVLIEEARTLLSSARSAVPVWIMPLNRVYESFNPMETKFDVVIIDEASQADITGLAALYLGKEHIVVGDDRQVTPDAVGQDLTGVQNLIDEMLQAIPNRQLYDGQTSIYELAEMAFGGTVALREHFRCIPEIIQFSNDLSYNNAIKPLREPFSSPLRPALVAHRVNGVRSDGKTNMMEAEETAALILACLEDEAYLANESGRPTTFGVISLLGDEQALAIETILRQRLSPELFEKHRLLCGNAAQFQGDERDVMFLSMVDGPPDEPPHTLRAEGAKNIYKKRYNVAVSRARNQLWVVYSLDPELHLKPGDIRKRLIDHALDPQALMRTIEEQGARTDSIFEKMVLQRLVSAGYRVRSQWPVGAYRIDLVVEGRNRKLAIECDGERWHTAENLQKDLERQAILERLGWIFVRIRGSVFFRDEIRAMAPVFEKLEELEIERLGSEVKPELAEINSTISRIRLKAEAVRRTWNESTPFDN